MNERCKKLWSPIMCVYCMYCWLWRRNNVQRKQSQGEDGEEWESLVGSGLRDKMCDSNNPHSYRLMYCSYRLMHCEIQRWPPIGHVAERGEWEKLQSIPRTSGIEIVKSNGKWEGKWEELYGCQLYLSRTVFLLFDIVLFKIQKNGTIQKDKSHKIFLILCFLFLTLCSMLFDLVWFVTICGMTGV